MNSILVLGNDSINQLNYYTWKDAIDAGLIKYMKFGRKKGFFSFILRVLENRTLHHILPFLSPLRNSFKNSLMMGKCVDSLPVDEDIVVFSYSSIIDMGKYNIERCKKSNRKIVAYFLDSLKTTDEFFYSEVLESLPLFDEIFSFDKVECEKYGFTYHEQIASPFHVNTDLEEADVYFAGRDKGRFDMIIAIASLLHNNGLSCRFRIPGLNNDQKNELNGFVGSALEGMTSYRSVLQEIEKSKCLIDVVQSKQHGISWRIVEALYFNKKIISNNPSLLENKYYNPDYMFYFQRAEDIDIEWVKMDVLVDYHYAGDYSSESFVRECLMKN